MERIIKNWERLIGKFALSGYYLVYSLIIISNRTYLIDENLVLVKKAYINHSYILIWIGYIILLIEEYMLYRRIHHDEVTILYYPQIKWQIIKIAIVIIYHIVFWIMVNLAILNMILVILLASTFFLIPTLNKNSIFETKRYIICSGVKYYYNCIEDFNDESGYKVLLQINGKEITVPCGSDRKYDILLKTLEKCIS